MLTKCYNENFKVAGLKIYSASARHYLAFGAFVSEELSYKINEPDRVRWVLPDSYLDVRNKDYGREPFTDRPKQRDIGRSRNFEGREMQINRGPTYRPFRMGWHNTDEPSNKGVQLNRRAPHMGSTTPNMQEVSTTVSLPSNSTSGFQKRVYLPPNKMSILPEMLRMPPDNMPGPMQIGSKASNYISGKTLSRVLRIYDTDCRRLSTAAVSTDSHPILQSDSFKHWFKNWQELRKDKLTASTFSAAIGFWHNAKRREQLWEEKIGVREPFCGNLATCWNNIKECKALERYMEITENSVSLTGFQVYGKKKNPEDDWLAASPDAVLDKKLYDLPFGGILEIKCPYFNGDMSSATPLKRLRVHYIPQAQGLMEILDREWMDLFVWTTKGSSLFRLYRNVEYWRLIKPALSDFWWKHVQPARQLCKESAISNPYEELASFRPAPKHKLLRTIIHESKQIVIDSELIMREINGKSQI